MCFKKYRTLLLKRKMYIKKRVVFLNLFLQRIKIQTTIHVVAWGWVILAPCLKLVRIMLETCFWYLSTHTYLQYLAEIVETKSIPGKIYGNSGMIHFAEINQVSSPYSMLQHIGRVTTPKLVSGHCLRYLQTTLIMGGGGMVSEFM